VKKLRLSEIAAIISLICAVAAMRAQAPAGPNRPAQVPEDYVVTPFGYFHPSCVIHLAKGEEVLEDGRIQRTDGTMYAVPVCGYAHYTARGRMFAASPIKPPTITFSWIEAWSITTNTSYGEIVANWNVLSAPPSYDDQTIYLFPGLQDYNINTIILQPVLGWNADFDRAWGIASWNCCRGGNGYESPAVPVNTGDLIVGTVKSTCTPGTLSCPTWDITTQDQSTGGSTTLTNTPSDGQTFNWAFAGVLEAYSIVQCSDYPPDQYITFYPTLYDNNFNIIENPSWSFYDYAFRLTPQCRYNGQASPGEVTLEFGGNTLTVSSSGDGVVTSTDGYINCPGTCTYNYPDNTQVTLNETPATGWAFTDWGGACSGNGACNFAMTQSLSVTATFTQLPVTLTASVVGNGTVTSTDGFINCPGTCQHTYDPNTPVTLNATPGSGWTFSGWTGACIGVGPCSLLMTQNLSVTGVFIQPGPGQGFQLQATMPCRLVDTRQGSPIQGGSSESFVVPQLGGCNIPSNAIAYSLNVTVVPHRPLGYLTIWPTGEAQPLASLMNSQDARVKANAAIVPAGGNGAVSVYVTDTSDVILDTDGYFTAPGAGTLQFYPLTPCRVVDTRTSSQQPQGLGPPSLHDMETRELPILSTTCPGLPANPAAYSFNVTVVPSPAGQPENYVTLWPSDQPQPVVSTLNNYTATVVANAAIVPAASDGSIKVFAYNRTDLLIDINGYFAAPGQGGYSFYPTAPCRAYDSRNNNGQPFTGEKTVNIAGSPCAPPGNAAGYVFNATVVPSPTLGYLTLWADSQQQPVVSTLNAYDGFVTSNMAIVPNVNGSIDAYADGMTHLILDISGYFAP